MILAYFSPEVVLPVASVLAAVMGFIMMVGRAPIRFVARGFRTAARSVTRLSDRSSTGTTASEERADSDGGPDAESPQIGPRV
jgi:hypothetical protein